MCVYLVGSFFAFSYAVLALSTSFAVLQFYNKRIIDFFYLEKRQTPLLFLFGFGFDVVAHIAREFDRDRQCRGVTGCRFYQQ